MEGEIVTPHTSPSTLLLRNFSRQSTARTSPQKISKRLVPAACEELQNNYLCGHCFNDFSIIIATIVVIDDATIDTMITLRSFLKLNQSFLYHELNNIKPL